MNKMFLFIDYLDIEEIKADLQKSEIRKFYEKENNTIVVQESDYVQVVIAKNITGTFTLAKFPQIGNPVQIISTILFLALIGLIFPFPFYFVVAIMLGQVASFGFYYPKIVKLQHKVNDLLIEINEVSG